jgi:hypothetical protein
VDSDWRIVKKEREREREGRVERSGKLLAESEWQEFADPSSTIR